jgi:hypothetical protein
LIFHIHVAPTLFFLLIRLDYGQGAKALVSWMGWKAVR